MKGRTGEGEEASERARQRVEAARRKERIGQAFQGQLSATGGQRCLLTVNNAVNRTVPFRN